MLQMTTQMFRKRNQNPFKQRYRVHARQMLLWRCEGRSDFNEWPPSRNQSPDAKIQLCPEKWGVQQLHFQSFESLQHVLAIHCLFWPWKLYLTNQRIRKHQDQTNPSSRATQVDNHLLDVHHGNKWPLCMHLGWRTLPTVHNGPWLCHRARVRW